MNLTDYPEREKYLQYVARRREDGLKDIKFFPAGRAAESSEHVYAELNRMVSSADCPLPEGF